MSEKKGPSVGTGLLIALVAMAVVSIAFMGEKSNITGHVVADSNENVLQLKEFKDINSLGQLAAGKYFIAANGVVYYMDDSSRYPIARLNYIEDAQKNTFIYIDSRGNIGYLIQ